jgi:hypothetical protein
MTRTSHIRTLVPILIAAGAWLMFAGQSTADDYSGRFQFIFEAEQHLEHAKSILSSQAGHHFYGHKQRAIEIIDRAFRELQEGVKEFRERGPARVNDGTAGMMTREQWIKRAPGEPAEFSFMHEAMRELHDAQWVLIKQAEGRFYGHKRRAVDLIGDAMDELHAGMEEYRAKGPSHGARHEHEAAEEEHEHHHEYQHEQHGHHGSMNPTPQPTPARRHH